MIRYDIGTEWFSSATDLNDDVGTDSKERA